MLQIILSVLAAVCYGWIERFLFTKIQGSATGNKRIGSFAFPYHIPMMMFLFFVIAWPNWQLVPVLLIIQDLSYFYFAGRHIKSSSWVSKIVGHFTLFNNIIPYAYVLGIVATWLLYLFY